MFRSLWPGYRAAARACRWCLRCSEGAKEGVDVIAFRFLHVARGLQAQANFSEPPRGEVRKTGASDDPAPLRRRAHEGLGFPESLPTGNRAFA